MSSGSAERLPAEPDWRLVELARAGSDAAFDALADRHGAHMRGECRRLVAGRPGDERLLDEIVEQALLCARIALRSGEAIRDARAWLEGVAHRSARTFALG